MNIGRFEALSILPPKRIRFNGNVYRNVSADPASPNVLSLKAEFDLEAVHQLAENAIFRLGYLKSVKRYVVLFGTDFLDCDQRKAKKLFTEYKKQYGK